MKSRSPQPTRLPRATLISCSKLIAISFHQAAKGEQQLCVNGIAQWPDPCSYVRMTKFFSEQNRLNPTGIGDFNRTEFVMMRRVFDGVCREASIPSGALEFDQRLARTILDVAKTKPSEAKLYADALKFARDYAQHYCG